MLTQSAILSFFLTVLGHLHQISPLCCFHLVYICSMQILSAFAQCKYFGICSLQILSAFVLSRLDYCNFLFVDLPDWPLDKLPTAQNNTANIILCKQKASHITPLLHDICTGSKFRVASNSRFPYFAIKLFMALPQSMSKLVSPCQPGRSVFSAHASFLCSA